MTFANTIKTEIQKYPHGMPFATSSFLTKGGRRANVDKVLSRLVQKGDIMRVSQGVFVKPKVNRYIGSIFPDVTEVVQTIAQNNNETIQVHGAEAIRRFGLSTQVPMQLVFLTNGTSREIKVGNQTVKFIHTSNQKKLQYSGTKVGVALSALWYLGKDGVNSHVIKQVINQLTSQEAEQLTSCALPGWLLKIIQEVDNDR